MVLGKTLLEKDLERRLILTTRTHVSQGKDERTTPRLRFAELAKLAELDDGGRLDRHADRLDEGALASTDAFEVGHVAHPLKLGRRAFYREVHDF